MVSRATCPSLLSQQLLPQVAVCGELRLERGCTAQQSAQLLPGGSVSATELHTGHPRMAFLRTSLIQVSGPLCRGFALCRVSVTRTLTGSGKDLHRSLSWQVRELCSPPIMPALKPGFPLLIASAFLTPAGQGDREQPTVRNGRRSHRRSSSS